MATPITHNPHPRAKMTDEKNLGFGKNFTDHMLMMDYSVDKGWYDAKIVPYQQLSLDPATMVLHYGQAIFEGLKAYRADDGVRLFRPMENVKRLNRSAERMSIPVLPEDKVYEAMTDLIRLEADWIPQSEGASLYVRPTVIATDPFLGVSASKTYLFFVILSPSGAYYPGGLAAVKIWVEPQYVRAVRGGIGFTKAAANYAASLYAGEAAKKAGYTQVLWLDGIEQKYIEEVGAMNMCFVIDGKLVTPELNGSILPGITRDSVLTLARDMGYAVEERRVALEEIIDGIRTGRLTEAFGTGTAAVVSPVGWLGYGKESFEIGGGVIGPVAQRMYDTIIGIQYGRLPDTHNWSTLL